MEFLERLQTLEKKWNENKITRAKLEEKRDNFKIEYQKLLTELETVGVKEEDLGQTYTNLHVEIDEKLSEYEGQLQ